MFDRQCKNAVSVLLAFTIVGAPLSYSVRAQSQQQSAAAPKLTDLFNEFKAINAATADPDERMRLLMRTIEARPELVRLEGGAGNIAYASNDYVKANAASAQKLEQWYGEFVPLVQKTLAAEPYQASEFDYRLANSLLEKNVLLVQAAQLAEQAVNSFYEDDVVARERERRRTPQARAHSGAEDTQAGDQAKAAEKAGDEYTKDESSMRSDATEHFHRNLAARYSLLAQLQMKTGQDQAATKSFEHALQLHPDMPAYMGEAALQEKQGDREHALTLLFDAYLTGHMSAADIEHMRDLYRELHPGIGETQLNALLDARYNATFSNPVKFSTYRPGASAPSRKVLAELFTGAACEPCISPDLAFEAALRRYGRDELVLLAYHDNAPAADPLANPVTDERGKYYSTGGSTPHVFLDGKTLDLSQGLQSHAQESADELFAAVDKELVGTADAHVEVDAVRHGNTIEVTARVRAPAGGNRRKLHVDLIEKELSYSGENGLHFQPMVVRATARQGTAGSGFEIPADGSLAVHYTFDLPQIEAANNAYYDHHAEDLKKRSNGMLDVIYREKKAAIDPTRLAIAAFVQDDSDKQVLQSAFSDVRERGQPAAHGS
jgi:tetratricopeptide (TPR) repeat protein